MEANGGARTVTGQIKRFDAHEGYGFIPPSSPLGGSGASVHMETLRRCNALELQESQKVKVRVATGREASWQRKFHY